jgi:adenosylmethionine-8-amino-7-oxononanoate aminotransferase
MQSTNCFNHIWMPFTSWQDSIDYPPLVIRRASGIYLYDQDDKSYIDATGSWWVSLFGHNHPEINDAVKRQLDRIEHVMMAGCISEPTIRLSELLAELLPPGLDKLFFSDNGSTAVEVAMKIALQYQHQTGNGRRRLFIGLGGGYHGDTLGAMSVGSIAQYHSFFHDSFKKELYTDPPYCYRCPCNKDPHHCSAECMDSLATMLSEHAPHVAAVIFEPMVQGAAGMRIYPAVVLQKIFELCRQYDILTIADEVAVGFGRTGKMFACNHAEVVPDIMCLAKGLTGGYLPMSVTAVSETVFDAFKGDAFSNRTFEHGHTFTGNPLACAAACAAIELLKVYGIPESLKTPAHNLSHLLHSFSRYPIVGDIRTLGMVAAIELVRDKNTRERLPAEKRIPFFISRNALKRGLLLRPLGDVIYFMLPYITTREQMEHIIAVTHEAFTDTLDELTADF